MSCMSETSDVADCALDGDMAFSSSPVTGEGKPALFE